MNSAQESKNELEAAIRYAENAISSAKQTIESMEFRQQMAQKNYQEQTGREEALTKLTKELEEANEKLAVDNSNLESKVQALQEAIVDLERRLTEAKTNMALMTDELEKLRGEKEASSGPCGCQAYRDLEEKVGDLESEVNALEQPERDKARLDKVCAPTNPVIPKDVAIAIFREGVAYGVSKACDELDNSADIEISETGYTGDFEVSFTKYIELSDHIDLDWLRSEVGVNDEADVIEALKNLCADNKFECRIHGVDDQEEKKND